ncbi:hypothetical protein BV898_16185 [Hypsibius exemplaris]|uniref:Uncharacterized protein n=1 Tax=Hypsibius exemplaris TaxID=2072580 RepID=A0A9X6NFD3_HYPEX|nr:hypothetical protein BV898_16185 [Hypsibius exemplaris]
MPWKRSFPGYPPIDLIDSQGQKVDLQPLPRPKLEKHPKESEVNHVRVTSREWFQKDSQLSEEKSDKLPPIMKSNARMPGKCKIQPTLRETWKVRKRTRNNGWEDLTKKDMVDGSSSSCEEVSPGKVAPGPPAVERKWAIVPAKKSAIELKVLLSDARDEDDPPKRTQAPPTLQHQTVLQSNPAVQQGEAFIVYVSQSSATSSSSSGSGSSGDSTSSGTDTDSSNSGSNGTTSSQKSDLEYRNSRPAGGTTSSQKSDLEYRNSRPTGGTTSSQKSDLEYRNSRPTGGITSSQKSDLEYRNSQPSGRLDDSIRDAEELLDGGGLGVAAEVEVDDDGGLQEHDFQPQQQGNGSSNRQSHSWNDEVEQAVRDVTNRMSALPSSGRFGYVSDTPVRTGRVLVNDSPEYRSGRMGPGEVYVDSLTLGDEE